MSVLAPVPIHRPCRSAGGQREIQETALAVIGVATATKELAKISSTVKAECVTSTGIEQNHLATQSLEVVPKVICSGLQEV
jgi:hypothetical protein